MAKKSVKRYSNSQQRNTFKCNHFITQKYVQMQSLLHISWWKRQEDSTKGRWGPGTLAHTVGGFADVQKLLERYLVLPLELQPLHLSDTTSNVLTHVKHTQYNNCMPIDRKQHKPMGHLKLGSSCVLCNSNSCSETQDAENTVTATPWAFYK